MMLLFSFYKVKNMYIWGIKVMPLLVGDEAKLQPIIPLAPELMFLIFH